MTMFRVRRRDGDAPEDVSVTNPIPVSLEQRNDLGRLIREVTTGVANTALSFQTSIDLRQRRLLMVTVAYSAAPTQAGITTTLNIGSGYDVTLSTGTANTRYYVFIPDADLPLLQEDRITVAAPAGGSGITASVTVVTEAR